MILRSIILAGTAAVSLGSAQAWAQNSTLTENLNNTGIPRNAPSLGLSNIYGLNPCSSGASVGVSTPLFGIGGAISDIDKECETRNNAAVVISALKDESLAREILCQIKDIRQAAFRVGAPCLQDQTGAKISAVSPSPTQDPAPSIAAAKPAAASIRSDAPAFCHTMHLDVALYPECTAAPAQASDVTASQTKPTTTSSKPSVARKDSKPVVKAESRPVLATVPVVPVSWHTLPAVAASDSSGSKNADVIAAHLQNLEAALIAHRQEATQAKAPTQASGRATSDASRLAYLAKTDQ